MTRESQRRESTGREMAAREDAKREPYVPPMAEDIDTTLSPAELATGASRSLAPSGGTTLGAEESGRWH